MKHDTETGLTIDWAQINNGLYGFSRKGVLLPNGMKKWIFSNNDGCEIIYITYTDKDGDDIVSDAYFMSKEIYCDKRIRYSVDML